VVFFKKYYERKLLTETYQEKKENKTYRNIYNRLHRINNDGSIGDYYIDKESKAELGAKDQTTKSIKSTSEIHA